jgi:hypothetical protein
MKFFIAAMMSLVVASATAQVSPVSVALTVGQWVLKDTKRVYQVRVTSTGKNPQDARQNAFRKAIELAVGSLVLGETEVKNDTLTRNEIISYSSGYVDDFKIINETGDSVTMDVWVSDSKFAERIEAMGQSSDAKVNGHQMRSDWDRRQAQEDTAELRRKDGVRLMNAVLADYPRAAYKVSINKTSLLKSKSGSPILSFLVKIEFNDKYADSLAEALVLTRDGVINDRTNNGLWVHKGWANLTKGFWRDGTRQQWISTFSRPVSLEIDFGDTKGCWDLFTKLDGRFFGYHKDGDYTIEARSSLKEHFNYVNHPHWKIKDSDFLTWATSINKVEARIVDTNSCGK